MKINIYTDGACSGNPGPGGYAYVILVDGIQMQQYARGFRKTTNNRMEIMAVVKALFIVVNHLTKGTPAEITVYSDSQLVINTMNKAWGKKSNLDLWQYLNKAITRILNINPENKVVFEKVKGHADDKWNNAVDNLAVSASKNNPDNIDEEYEKSVPEKTEEDNSENNDDTLHVSNIRLCNVNTTSLRKVEIDLSNGTVVRIVGKYDGFEQYGCTKTEAAITVDYAIKFTRWLNGGEL